MIKSCDRAGIISTNCSQAAFREAGKAVVATALGLPIESVSIWKTPLSSIWLGRTEILRCPTAMATNFLAVAPWRADPRCASTTDPIALAVDSILDENRIDLIRLQIRLTRHYVLRRWDIGLNDVVAFDLASFARGQR